MQFNEPFGGRTVRHHIDLFRLWHLSRAHHAFCLLRSVPEGMRIGPELAGAFVSAAVPETGCSRRADHFCDGVSGARKPVPAGIWRFKKAGGQNCQGKPSIACWRDQALGASRRRSTPIPRGSRPSIAALTRLGAKKASEIVMLTWRTLQPSRAAMLSAFAVEFVITSLSHLRPRAIDATKVARVSERIGRTACGATDMGRRISRRRLQPVLRHDTFSTLRPRDPLEPFDFVSVSWITN
jgi:hypothetical protein